MELGAAFAVSLAAAGTDLQAFLKGLNPAWNLVGRVHFNLVENRRDQDHPFAFMATYTTRLSAEAKAQHVPLGQALREYSGAANRDKLLSLLLPVQRAAEICGWLKAMVDAGEIFHPLRWSPDDALRAAARTAVSELRLTVSQGRIPSPLKDSPKCPRCALVAVCLPDEVRALTGLVAGAALDRRARR